jgi:hypothetical protein
MHDTLREQVRALAGRGPQPTVAIIDSKSAKAADTVGKASWRMIDHGHGRPGREKSLTAPSQGYPPGYLSVGSS